MNASHPSAPDLSADQAQPVSAAKPRRSAFDAQGFRKTVAELQEEIRVLYTADNVPWIIGYSGGKDSTTTLQLIWTERRGLAPHKPLLLLAIMDMIEEGKITGPWISYSPGRSGTHPQALGKRRQRPTQRPRADARRPLDV
ncbi:hypothetical protein [uncultured Thiodictyon sp.]|jgi:DNA sulfur modification protein DndC|uniref:hypothetical protein n=1 Tax=uncultured Thiodictyon sp. TaxID=1846217 RepID=UPI0025D86453|nr:hypothetical protein [uncultured Thiodictyon sp.]